MKKLVGIITLIVCMAMLLCGCGGWYSVSEIKITSRQSEQQVTFKVSGKTHDNWIGMLGKARYWSDKSKDDAIAEFIKKNNATVTEICGYQFITIPDVDGIYNLRASDTADGTKVIVDDMSIDVKTVYNQKECNMLFPAFLLSDADDPNAEPWDDGVVYFGREYRCEADKMLALAKELDFWYIAEGDGWFTLYDGDTGIKVTKEDEKVTLQQLPLVRQSVLTYDTTANESDIFALIEKSGAKIITYETDTFIAVPREFPLNDVYRLQMTALNGNDYKYHIVIDRMYTTIVSADGTRVCEMPFPYIYLSDEGEPCNVRLEFGKTYTCSTDLLAFIDATRCWRAYELENGVQIGYGNLRVRAIFSDGTVTLQPVA